MKKQKENFVYVSLMDSIKEGFESLTDNIELDGYMKKESYDKDEDNVVDIAKTLVGLKANIEELNKLIGVHTNVQEQIDTIAKRKPKMVKTIKTLDVTKGQDEFVFDRNIEEDLIVELRSNSVWIHDEDYTISDNKVIMKKPFMYDTQVDFVFYEIVF